MINFANSDEFKDIWYRDRTYLTGAHIKNIAMVLMLLSHLAQTGFLYQLNSICWTIADIFVFLGRISMPIFCFFTVQAIIHTKDIKKYFKRLLIFAIISEIPFNLAIFNSLFYPNSQNVMFTILIGALTIYFIDLFLNKDISLWLKIFAIIIISLIGSVLSYSLNVDYGYNAILAIIFLYLAKDNKYITVLAILIGFAFEFIVGGYSILRTYGFVYLSIPIIMLYNGQRGKQNKWTFYIFYPGHLLVIYLLKLFYL